MTPAETSVEAYIGLLVQIPLVGIFVWFSLTLIKIFLTSLEKRDAQWQSFLDEQRRSYHDAIANMAGRFGDEIRILGKEMSELKGKMDK